MKSMSVEGHYLDDALSMHVGTLGEMSKVMESANPSLCGHTDGIVARCYEMLLDDCSTYGEILDAMLKTCVLYAAGALQIIDEQSAVFTAEKILGEEQ